MLPISDPVLLRTTNQSMRELSEEPSLPSRLTVALSALPEQNSPNKSVSPSSSVASSDDGVSTPTSSSNSSTTSSISSTSSVSTYRTVNVPYDSEEGSALLRRKESLLFWNTYYAPSDSETASQTARKEGRKGKFGRLFRKHSKKKTDLPQSIDETLVAMGLADMEYSRYMANTT